MQIEKCQPSGKRITSVNLVSGFVRLPSVWDFSVSESETDDRFCLSLGSIGKYSIYKIMYLKEIQKTKKGKNYFLKAQFNTNSAIDCSGPEVIKLFSCSTQLSMKFFLLIKVKMPTTVGILTFMSGKNSILGLSEPNKSRIS